MMKENSGNGLIVMFALESPEKNGSVSSTNKMKKGQLERELNLDAP